MTNSNNKIVIGIMGIFLGIVGLCYSIGFYPYTPWYFFAISIVLLVTSFKVYEIGKDEFDKSCLKEQNPNTGE